MATRLTLAGEQAEAFDQQMVVAFALNAASYLRTDPEPFATVSMQQQEGRRSRKKPQGF